MVLQLNMHGHINTEQMLVYLLTKGLPPSTLRKQVAAGMSLTKHL
jgi:hypothetical protein